MNIVGDMPPPARGCLPREAGVAGIFIQSDFYQETATFSVMGQSNM